MCDLLASSGLVGLVWCERGAVGVGAGVGVGAIRVQVHHGKADAVLY